MKKRKDGGRNRGREKGERKKEWNMRGKDKREEMSERGDGSSKEETGGEVVKMKSNKLLLLQCQ